MKKTKNIDLPEIKARFDTLYFQLQILEKAIELKQSEISKMFGIDSDKWKNEITTMLSSIEYFCISIFPERISSMKKVINKIKRLI